MSNCAKVLSIMGASLIIAAGLAGIAISIYLFVQNQIWNEVIGNYQLTFAILFIVVSCLITLTGAFGIFGACSNNKCLLHTFWVFLVIWVCAFIAAGVVAVVLPNKVLAEGCRSTTSFQDLQNVATSAYNSDFCKTGCSCYVANTSRLTSSYNAVSNTDTSLAKNVDSCTSWTKGVYDTVMAGLQKAFECTTWCGVSPLPPIFYFYNNDNTNLYPTDNCFNAFSNFFAKYGQYVYIASFVFAGVLFILTICTWVYICHIGDLPKE